MLHLPAAGDLVVAGDLHNHLRNFQRIQAYADLKGHPKRGVILQELIHGGPLGPQGQDTSFDMLIEAVQWAQAFPQQVHFLLANHDLSQVQRLPVMKDGYDLTDRFTRHLQLKYGGQADEVAAALQDFIYSQALAAISVNGLFLSHSLPGPRDLAGFDATVLRRPLVEADYTRTGSVHKLVWGRHQNGEVLTSLAKLWWADVFICGHQQQEQGIGTIEPNLMIVDSSHNHGALLRLDLGRPYTLAGLRAGIVPLAAIA